MIYYFPVPTRVPVMCDTRNFFGNAAGCKLFLNERDSDVSIHVDWKGCLWHYPAHRLILSSMSDVFHTMLETDMLERKNGVIIITDKSPLTVKQFLKYLYMGILDFNGWVEAIDLMKIAHKYRVMTLVALCEAHLVTTISFSNVCYLYEMAQTYSLGTLRKDASYFIQDAAFLVSSTEGFLNMSSKSVEFFLSCPRFNMENECCVLTTLKEWSVVECCRRGISLTHENVLSIMEPFMQHIHWQLIPEELRTFVPEDMVQMHAGQTSGRRKPFHVSPSLQYHVSVLKFMVELGAYDNRAFDGEGINCLKFGVDSHAYVAGFRIVGMFKIGSLHTLGPSSLTLARDDNSSCTQFNLNSLPWTKGSTVGDYAWREMTAYLPYPLRIDPFSVYVINLKYGARKDIGITKWPVTRLECGAIKTDLGPISFFCYSACYGITQLFMLPAPPNRNICNDDL